ncbi:DUF4224 domain-containing protein [Solimonas terrae]|uniref:DUF4224 domain-containing protein n=1 Tax=Solimonas terrae TaxID=1396819 RepID=A0A6M2BMQ9_9GAMM|nr:DUF4224 domain-containing protein [Solimonas terrae]NGY03445.1 DUF4224 domain-containing protein [Solimonas terrae]
MFLTDEEIESLTRKKQHAAQARALDAIGLKYAMRGDGSLVVLHSAVEALLNPDTKRKPKPAIPEPNWDAIR